jgi:hypothetical protein
VECFDSEGCFYHWAWEARGKHAEKPGNKLEKNSRKKTKITEKKHKETMKHIGNTWENRENHR